jgi:RND family efflux transporter MFP subunit
MRRWYYFLPLVVVILAGAIFWWFSRPPAVTLVAVTVGPAVEAVYATGTVEPRRWAALASTELGRIVEYPATENAEVAAGAMLVRLDDETLQAELEELLARVDFLEKDVERYRALLERESVSRQTYERLVSELAAARAAANARAQRLADMTIVAPFDGLVLRKDGEIGEVVQPGDVLVWLGQPPPYWISAEVDEEDIPRVQMGHEVLITADAFPGRVLEGKVIEITPMGDVVNKQYRVRIGLPADSPLLVGMTVEVNVIIRRETEALLIPDTAVRGGSVFLIEDGRAVQREIKVGVFGRDSVEVLEGLAEGERVIAQPPAVLANGDAVRVVEAD